MIAELRNSSIAIARAAAGRLRNRCSVLDQRLARPTQQDGLVTHLTWWQCGERLLEMGKAFACDTVHVSCDTTSKCSQY